MNEVPKGFQSKMGRLFSIGPVERYPDRFLDDTFWCDTFPILRHGKPAGKLFRSLTYGTTADGQARWHASICELRSPFLFTLHRGIGYDVSAFDTAEQALEAWARSADEILDFALTQGAKETEGK